MFSPYGMNQKRVQKGLSAAASEARQATRGRGCELAGVARARQARPFSARIRTRAYGKNTRLMTATALHRCFWTAFALLLCIQLNYRERHSIVVQLSR